MSKDTKFVRNLIILFVIVFVLFLASYLLPGFWAYRVNSKIIFCEMTCETIRNAIQKYAEKSGRHIHMFPEKINNWDELRDICNAHGANLKQTENEQFIFFQKYSTWDTDGDGVKGDDYYFIFRVPGVRQDVTGSMLEVRPTGIKRHTY